MINKIDNIERVLIFFGIIKVRKRIAHNRMVLVEGFRIVKWNPLTYIYIVLVVLPISIGFGIWEGIETWWTNYSR